MTEPHLEKLRDVLIWLRMLLYVLKKYSKMNGNYMITSLNNCYLMMEKIK